MMGQTGQVPYSVCFARPVCLRGRSVCPGIAAVISSHWPDRPPTRLGPHTVRRSTAVTSWSRWPPVGSSVCAPHSNSDALEQHDTGCVRHLFWIRFIPLYLFCNILYTYLYLVHITVGLARTPAAEFASIILMLSQDTKDRAVAVYGF